jgi:hypothetical protein
MSRVFPLSLRGAQPTENLMRRNRIQAGARLKGQKNGWKILKTVMKDKIREVV